MTLTERIALAEERPVTPECAFVGCARQAVRDARVCSSHLADLWANRLELRPDRTYAPVGRTPEWVLRAQQHRLTAKALA